MLAGVDSLAGIDGACPCNNPTATWKRLIYKPGGILTLTITVATVVGIFVAAFTSRRLEIIRRHTAARQNFLAQTNPLGNVPVGRYVDAPRRSPSWHTAIFVATLRVYLLLLTDNYCMSRDFSVVNILTNRVLYYCFACNLLICLLCRITNKLLSCHNFSVN